MRLDYTQGEVIVTLDIAGSLPQFGFGSVNIIPLLIAEGFSVKVDKALQGLFDYWGEQVSSDWLYEFDGNSVKMGDKISLSLGAGDIPEWESLLAEWKDCYGESEA